MMERMALAGSWFRDIDSTCLAAETWLSTWQRRLRARDACTQEHPRQRPRQARAGSESPRSSAATNAPANASPAPVVSITSTGGGSDRTGSPSMHRDRAARTQGQDNGNAELFPCIRDKRHRIGGRAPCRRVEGCFVLVDDQHVETAEQRGGQARRRRGIQNDACPGPVRAHRQRLDFRHWNLELHEKRVPRRESLVRDAFGTRQRIGARHDGDRVFAIDRRHESARRPSPSRPARHPRAARPRRQDWPAPRMRSDRARRHRTTQRPRRPAAPRAPDSRLCRRAP